MPRTISLPYGTDPSKLKEVPKEMMVKGKAWLQQLGFGAVKVLLGPGSKMDWTKDFDICFIPGGPSGPSGPIFYLNRRKGRSLMQLNNPSNGQSYLEAILLNRKEIVLQEDIHCLELGEILPEWMEKGKAFGKTLTGGTTYEVAILALESHAKIVDHKQDRDNEGYFQTLNDSICCKGQSHSLDNPTNEDLCVISIKWW